MMTKHAHPLLHQGMSNLFNALFGGDWKIINPFVDLTKRECVQQAVSVAKSESIKDVLSRTESCWFLHSPQFYGEKKKPGRPCGTCVPCLIRLTALSGDSEFDLTKEKVKKHSSKGASFRAYDAFLTKVLAAGNSPAKFYTILPAAGRDLANKDVGLSLDDLHRLFGTFAREFMETFT
jgi:hypothetical protein